MMNTYVNKTQENKNQSVSKSVSQKKSSNRASFQFNDNRPVAIAQRKLQEIANNSQQVAQLRGFHHNANPNPQVKKLKGIIQLMEVSETDIGQAFNIIPNNTNTQVVGELVQISGSGWYIFNVGGQETKVRGRDHILSHAIQDRHGTAEDRLERMRERGERRKEIHGRIPTGRYDTPTGPTTLSGLFKQRMTQSRKGDYGGQTFGSVPPYSGLQAVIPPNALSTLSDRHSPGPQGLSDRQRLATSLAHTLTNASEEDRVPGTSSYNRAIVRDYVRTGGQGYHPLSTALLPARSSAQEQRDLMEGRISLSDQQRRALEEDSASSSEAEDNHFINR